MQLFSLFGEILLKDNDVNKKIDDTDKKAGKLGGTFESSFEKIKSGVLKVGAALGVGLGFKALISEGYKFAESASDITEAQNVVETTFKKSGKAIEDWTSTTAKSAGISKTSSMQWVGYMGAMLKSSGVTESSSATMSKSLVQLTGDMSSFYNISTSDMWEKIRSGISGETEPLKAIGINMSVANLQAYALAEGLKKPYAQMTQAEQTTLRYNYLMKVTKDAQGDFGKTLSTSFANQVRVAQLNMDNLKASIGSKLLPVFNSAVTWLNSNMPKIQDTVNKVMDSIGNVVISVVPAFQKWIGLIGQIAKELLPSFGKSSDDIKGKLTDLAKNGLSFVTDALTWIRDNIPLVKAGITGLTAVLTIQKGVMLAHNIALIAHNVQMGIKKGLDIFETGQIVALYVAEDIHNGIVWAGVAAQTALNAVMSMNPIGLVIIAIGALIAIGAVLYNKCEGFRNFVNSLWNNLKKFAVGVKQDFEKLITDISTGIANFQTTISVILNSIKAFFTNTWNSIVSVVIAIINPFVTTISNLFNGMKDGLTTMFNGLKTFFAGVWNAIKLIILGPVLLIIDLVTGNFTKLSTDAKKIFDGLKNAFKEIWDGIKGIFKGYIEAIVVAAKTAWNTMVSTAKTIFNALKTFFSGLWNGIKSTATTAWNNLKSTIINVCNGIKTGAINIFNAILAFFRNLPSTLKTLGTNAFNGLKNGITSVLNTLGNVVSNGFNGAINFIKSLPSKALTWGKDFIDGLINGIKSKISAVTDAVSSVGDKIRSFLHFSVPDEGPLTDYESWMPDFMGGLAKGIEKSKNLVTNAVSGLSTDISTNVKVDSSDDGIIGTGINKIKNTTSQSSKPIILQVHTYLDGKEVATVTAPYTDRISGTNINLMKRGLIV